MKRFALITALILGLSSCYSPGQYPPPLRTQAMNEMESFMGYFLEGRLCDFYFNDKQTTEKFE